MVISANAGMGKSVISAVICKRMEEDGRLAGSHFCQHNNARYRNPQLLLQSLACHLCHALLEYKQVLEKQLSRNLGKDLNDMGVEELFSLLFKEPLSTVADPGRNMLMVIDGVDESEYQERNELLDVIANHFCKLPCWIRFLCTTRPERNVAEALKHLKPFLLESNDYKNVEDIRWFVDKRTQHLIKPEMKGAIVEKLVKKSEGLMLYAYFLVSFVEEDVSVLDQGDLDDSLPLAISSVYHSYFKRLEKELKLELSIKEDNFLNLLCTVTASREPMPTGFLSKLLVPNATSMLARRKVLKCIASVSSLLPIRDGCLHVIHKSVKDWLIDVSCYGEHDFTVDETEGHRILASLCADELDHLRKNGVRDAQFSSTEKYALRHGVRHMLKLEENLRLRSLEKCVETYVTDLDLLYAKLCLNRSMAVKEILWLQSQEHSRVLSADSKHLLSTLMVLLRKHFRTLTDHPHIFFQTLLNEGGSVLSSMASNMLQNKYPAVTYMEFVDKQIQERPFLARFQCSSEVACFDVSPRLDYMVCECADETIQLWSLHSGELLWKRPVRVTKSYLVFLGVFRRVSSLSDVLSCYRSVVFHPSEEVVLPGVLSHAYDFNGDLKHLFPQSSCSFTVCSISRDKTTMLTDCPHNSKCIILWSLKNGTEITRTTRNEPVLSFAWSRDGKLLAISHLTGVISIVDVVDDFRTVGQTTITRVSGMLTFSPHCQSLFCCHFSLDGFMESPIRLNINIAEHATFQVDVLDRSSVLPLEFQSRSEGGFVLGDPLQCSFDKQVFVGWTSDFVLDKQSVLRSYNNSGYLVMLNINDPEETEKVYLRRGWIRKIGQIVFSLTGEIICVSTSGGSIIACNVANGRTSVIQAGTEFHLPLASIMPMSISSMPYVGACSVSNPYTSLVTGSSIMPYLMHHESQHRCNHILAVEGGVLFFNSSGTPVLWNFELSKCIRQWPFISRVRRMIPISEERVAFETNERKVIILDTTSDETLATIPLGCKDDLLACNSKLQLLLLTESRHPLLLTDGKTTLWKNELSINREILSSEMFSVFSPAETSVIIGVTSLFDPGLHVFDAVSGKALHILFKGQGLLDCKFISDEECVVTCRATQGVCPLQLFNVKSGDLLSIIDMEREVNHLAACPRKRLLAIENMESEHGFALIQVQLPRDKDKQEEETVS